MTLLEARNVEKSFDGVQALDGAEIAVERGELVGLIGPNGAGKTTLFDCLSGTTDPDAGTVRFDGEDVTDLPTYRRARRGLVRTFQQTRELETLTVSENVRLPAVDHPGERAADALLRTDRVDEREAEVARRAGELVEFFDLGELADEYAAHLSGGQRKLLEFARALMLEPDLLMLDEPLAGVNPTLARKISGYVERMNEDGTTFLVVEHEIESLAALADRLVVLTHGRVLAEGAPSEVLADERVVEAYLGGG